MTRAILIECWCDMTWKLHVICDEKMIWDMQHGICDMKCIRNMNVCNTDIVPATPSTRTSGWWESKIAGPTACFKTKVCMRHDACIRQTWRRCSIDMRREARGERREARGGWGAGPAACYHIYYISYILYIIWSGANKYIWCTMCIIYYIKYISCTMCIIYYISYEQAEDEALALLPVTKTNLNRSAFHSAPTHMIYDIWYI
jgi:hypothetical protein